MAPGFSDFRLEERGENGVDGGFTGPTAWTLADYKGQPGFRGKGRFTDAELQDMVDTAASLGWQMGLHCIGDAAIQQTIIAYDKGLAKYPGLEPHKGTDRRWFTDHFTIMPPEATMATTSPSTWAADVGARSDDVPTVGNETIGIWRAAGG